MQKLVAFVVLSTLAVVSSHLCMLSPPQRGSMMNINKPASPDCFLRTGPCGGRKRGDSSIGIKAGSRFLVAFQKNLDHFYKENPGSFNITVSFDSEQTFLTLQLLPDTPDPALTLYYKNVTMPKEPINKQGTLQVGYLTNNPSAPFTFYQCGDIVLYN